MPDDVKQLTRGIGEHARAVGDRAKSERGTADPANGVASGPQRAPGEIRPPPLTPGEKRRLEQFVKDHARMPPAEFEATYRQPWLTAGPKADEVGRLLAQLRRHEEQELEKMPKFEKNRERQAAKDFAAYNRGAEGVKSGGPFGTLLTAAGLYVAAERGANLEELATMAETMSQAGSVAGMALSVSRGRPARQELHTSQGSAVRSPSGVAPQEVTVAAPVVSRGTASRGTSPVLRGVPQQPVVVESARSSVMPSPHPLPAPQPTTALGGAGASPTGLTGKTRRQSARATAVAAAEEGLVQPSEGRLGFQSYGTAPSVKKALQYTDTEAAHIVPQAIGRFIPGYSPLRALTTYLPKETHKAFDRGWIPKWNQAIKAGQKITAGDVRRWVGDAIDAIPPHLLTPQAKGTLHERLFQELYRDLQLTPGYEIVPAQQ